MRPMASAAMPEVSLSPTPRASADPEGRTAASVATGHQQPDPQAGAPRPGTEPRVIP
jgi:hypothetical protein